MEVTATMVKELREVTGAGMMDCKKALAECNGDMTASIEWLREKGIAKSAKKEARIAAEGLASIYIKDNKAVILEVNSETDFVSKNEEFTGMIDTIGSSILNSDAKDLDSALKVKTTDGTIEELIIAKTAKIGEKLSLRRLEVVVKNDDEVFGSYLHMGGKIVSLVVIKGANESVAKDVAMQAVAMHPSYVFVSDIPKEVIASERKVQKELAMSEGKPADIAEKMVEGRMKKFYKDVCLAEQPFIKDGDISVLDYVKKNNGEIKKVIRYEVGEGLEKRSENFAEEVMNQVKGN